MLSTILSNYRNRIDDESEIMLQYLDIMETFTINNITEIKPH